MDWSLWLSTLVTQPVRKTQLLTFQRGADQHWQTESVYQDAFTNLTPSPRAFLPPPAGEVTPDLLHLRLGGLDDGLVTI